MATEAGVMAPLPAPSPGAVLCALFALFLCVAGPAFLVRLLSWLHPKGSDRREMIDTLRLLPPRKRLIWSLGQIEPAVCDGLPARIAGLWSTAERRARERAKRRAEFEDAEAELARLIAELAHPAPALPRHAAALPPRRQAALPAFLLCTAAVAFGGLALLPSASSAVSPAAMTIVIDWGGASTAHVVVSVAAAVLALAATAVALLANRRASRRRAVFAALAAARRARAAGHRPTAALVLRYP